MSSVLKPVPTMSSLNVVAPASTVDGAGATSNVMNLAVISVSAPKLTSMNPSTVEAGATTFKMLIVGTGFKTDDIVQFNGSAIPTEYISATQIAGTVDASLVANAGTANITVTHKDGSGTSAPLTLNITTALAPNITGFSPSDASVGTAPFTLAILGKNFTSRSIETGRESCRG